MKILTLTIDFIPMSGGVARYADAVAQFFASNMRVVADIDAPEEDKARAIANAPYELEFKPFMRNRWPKWWGAVRHLKDCNEDIIFVHHVLPLGLACYINKMRRSTPYVVFFHGMDFTMATRNPWKRFLTKRVLREAKAVVANSIFLKNKIEEFSGRPAIVSYPLAALRGEPAGSNSEKVQIVSVCRATERKGIHRVLNAFAESELLRNKCHYTYAGVGYYAQALKNMVEDLNLKEHVTIHNVLDEAVFRSVYEKGDIFVVATESIPGDNEGFGIVYQEAATFGMPSVASSVPGVDESVLDGETGLLVDPGSNLVPTLERLVNDPELVRRLGANARKREANEITPQKQYAKLRKEIGL